MSDNITRRQFLGIATAATSALAGSTLISACRKKQDDKVEDDYHALAEPPVGKMTCRESNTTHDKVSLLAFGMMRLPTTKKVTKTEGNEETVEEEIDQETLNTMVDYAIEHGVNYFDTAPVYCRGLSERATGIALSRHPREKYLVATKMSNFAPETRSYEASMEMFDNSLKELQVDHIDFYLAHSVGRSIEEWNERFIDNGVLDRLVQLREEGKIRNLGFSFHGRKEVFDHILAYHEKCHWDFVMIQMNYLDWNFAEEMSDSNVNASYLYGELQKRGIQCNIMEPLLGGRLANVPHFVARAMKRRRPERSIASWAFRYAGTREGVLTVLSGMNCMEHLKDNLLSYCPLDPCDEEERQFLEETMARELFQMENIPCNDCQYCMPCPYGIDIPRIFTHYNKCKNEGTLPVNEENAEYRKLRRRYLIGLDREVPKLRQANHCIGCGECVPQCPQRINIPEEMRRIDRFVERLKSSPQPFP